MLALRPKWQHNMKITFSLSVGSEKTRRKGNFHITHVTFSLFFLFREEHHTRLESFFPLCAGKPPRTAFKRQVSRDKTSITTSTASISESCGTRKKIWVGQTDNFELFPLCKAPRALHSLSRRSLVINISSSINFSAMELQILALTTRSTYPAFFFA